MPEHSQDCVVCGAQLLYNTQPSLETCVYCGIREATHGRCAAGHYICDGCHAADALRLIERFCVGTDSTAPLVMAQLLMSNPALKMHGPEHHFLVPAILLAAYGNATAMPRKVLAEKMQSARQRAGDVKGGFCGMLGACGAAIGAGIFVSVMTGATPLSGKERRLSNSMTAECLGVIASHAGARCCKREVFWALITAKEFIRREFGVALPDEPFPICSFSDRNRECLREQCRFHASASDSKTGKHVAKT